MFTSLKRYLLKLKYLISKQLLIGRSIKAIAIAGIYITSTFIVSISLASCNLLNLDKSKNQSSIATPMVINKYDNNATIPNSLVLFNGNTNYLTGWNHVPSYPNEFIELKLPDDMYRIDRKTILTKGENVYSTTLIKKFGDWSHQHSNGIIAKFAKLPFSSIAGIEIVIRINGEISNLPDTEKINKTYSHLVDDKLLEKLDDGNVHLSFALRSQDPTSVKESQFNADYLISLNTKQQINNWYRIFIPVSKLKKYSEVNYEKTALFENEVKSMVVSNFKLTAETKSTKVIRNLIPDTFNENTPTLFKEIGVDIKYLGIVKNK